MHLTHFIVDDFLSDPDAVRRKGAAMAFPEEKALYPGRNSADTLFLDEVDQKIAALTHDRLMRTPAKSNGRFRLAVAGDEGTGGVHVDVNHWTAVIYLTPKEHCQGGTTFFRHKRTNTERAPVFPGEWQAMGYSHPNDVFNDIVNKDNKTPDAWERLFHIPMKYNRLALFRGYLWHDAGPSFGSGVEDGRLILTYFYHWAQG